MIQFRTIFTSMISQIWPNTHTKTVHLCGKGKESGSPHADTPNSKTGRYNLVLDGLRTLHTNKGDTK